MKVIYLIVMLIILSSHALGHDAVVVYSQKQLTLNSGQCCPVCVHKVADAERRVSCPPKLGPDLGVKLS